MHALKIYFVLLLEIFNSISSQHFLFYLAWAPFAINISLLHQGFYEGDNSTYQRNRTSMFSLTKQSSIFIQKEKPAWSENSSRPHRTARLLLMQGLHLNLDHPCIYTLDYLETKFLIHECLCNHDQNFTRFQRTRWDSVMQDSNHSPLQGCAEGSAQPQDSPALAACDSPPMCRANDSTHLTSRSYLGSSRWVFSVTDRTQSWFSG